MSNEDKPDRHLSTMFLFGAGASIPAGIPAIDQMTKEFLEGKPRVRQLTEKISTREHLPPGVDLLCKITLDYFQKMDLEFLMSIIIRIQDEKERLLFEQKYSELKSLEQEELEEIQHSIERFIRDQCENIKTVDYLWTLQGLPHLAPLDIFTLNYDSTIEIFCEKNDVKHTDGFDPYWNPVNFAENLGINIYKLHGSLYWFRSQSGKIIKVPIKGLDVSNIKYLTDESVSEMMIYPALQKDKESMVFSWISQKFKEQLNKFEVCVTIGYSFRDDDIKKNINESLSGNKELWLVIVSPHASKHKEEHFSYDDAIHSRIIVMNMGIEEALRERKLHSYLGILELARRAEKETWAMQRSNEYRLDYQWKQVLNNYLRLNHDDRVKWIVETLSQEHFSSVGSNFPEVIEGAVSAESLRYALEYKNKGNSEKMEIWGKIFLETLTAYEFKWFELTNQPKLKNNNPVKKTDMPHFCREGGGNPVDNDLNKILSELKLVKLENTKLQESVRKIIETIEFLLEKGRKGIVRQNPQEILDGYKDQNLGIKKWANVLCNNLI